MALMKSPITGRASMMMAAAGMSLVASFAVAQVQRPPSSTMPEVPGTTPTAAESASPNPHRSTLARMFRRVTTDFNENKLEDVMRFLEDFTGAPIEVYWAENGEEGLSREQTITMKIRNMTALNVLERVLAKANTDSLSGGSTWQMTEYGAIECGPKSILNRSKRVELYDIHDLLLEIPNHERVPQIDLQSLLQQSQSGGGGGGQSPFTDDNDNDTDRENRRSLQEKGEEIIRILTSIVEPEEWMDGGGEGGTIRYFNGNIMVNAPDYMHRQINGYPYWESSTSRMVGGRRYVSLNMDTSIGTVDGFKEVPVTAVVGGRPVSSNPGNNPGGGGSVTPAPRTTQGPKASTPASPSVQRPAGAPAATAPKAKEPIQKPIDSKPVKKEEKK